MRSAICAAATALAMVATLAASSAAQAALRAPALATPAASATVESVPTFTWGAVAGAAKYEFQISDDARFNSIVLGRGTGRGSQQTFNTAATLDKTLPDGNYFWRVRAIDRRDRVGRWSSGRPLKKAWTSAPVLTGPADETSVSWPALPLVLSWNPVKYATKYLVTIASDPTLAQVVGATGGKPVELPGTDFALQGTLPAGRYYWAVTPIDGGGLRGARSRVGTFTWTWPTAASTSVADLNASPRVFDPLLSWDLVPGAARYEVEINPDDDFAAGSRVCCKDAVIGTSLSPQRLLPNNTYYWRVRAYDVDGNPGQWNRGPVFTKAFDPVTPATPTTIPNLRVVDHTLATLTNSASAYSPIVMWDPVEGAAKYHVQWAPFNGSSCNWTFSNPIRTASVAWTPLSKTAAAIPVPGGVGIELNLDPNGNRARSGQPFNPEQDFTPSAKAFDYGEDYCVRVRALSDDSLRENDNSEAQVISAWTYAGGADDSPAFTYAEPPGPGSTQPFPNPVAYKAPVGAPGRTPLLRWDPVPGALRYYVFIARDPDFLNVVDAAYVQGPAYAPNWVLEDEETDYYWAVVPDGGVAANLGEPADHPPASFKKLSTGPSAIAPVGGAEVTTQPTFRWNPVEGAQKYYLEVSSDREFGDLVDSVVTASTAYTSSKPYPVDTALYWRVRGEQLQALKPPRRVELTWSATNVFRRKLPAPTFSPNIPLSGELPPLLTWSAVPGAISYDVHIDEADGDSNTFTNIKSAAGSFTRFFGIGTFKFKVRANFATRGGSIASAYSPQRDFTRLISPPPGPRASRTSSRLTFDWGPAAAAANYRVELSTTESFSRIVERATTSNTSWAPTMRSPVFAQRVPLYWRVATVDDGNNVGSFVAGPAVKGRSLSVRVSGRLRRNRTGRVTVTVRGAGKALSGASVRASGAGVRATTKRTNRRGRVTFTLRPRSRGTVTILVRRAGFADKTMTLRVR